MEIIGDLSVGSKLSKNVYFDKRSLEDGYFSDNDLKLKDTNFD